MRSLDDAEAEFVQVCKQIRDLDNRLRAARKRAEKLARYIEIARAKESPRTTDTPPGPSKVVWLTEATARSRMRRSTRPVQPAFVPRSVYVEGHRTSLRLEPVMWDALADIVEERGASIHDLVTQIADRYDAPNLSAAIRVFIVEFYRNRRPS